MIGRALGAIDHAAGRSRGPGMGRGAASYVPPLHHARHRLTRYTQAALGSGRKAADHCVDSI